MSECCILFAHDRADAATRRHYDLLCEHNPGFPVVPVHRGASQHLPGAVDLRPYLPALHGDTWGNADAFLYQWAGRCGLAGLDAERYVLFERHGPATACVRVGYDAVWDADAAATAVVRFEEAADRTWYWFHQVPWLPDDLRPHAAGVVPLDGVMLSRGALTAVASRPLPNGFFGELRLGSALRASGIEIQILPIRPVDWDATAPVPTPSAQGLDHPIRRRRSRHSDDQRTPPFPTTAAG